MTSAMTFASFVGRGQTIGSMPKHFAAFRFALALAPFAIAGALAVGCGLDDTVISAGVAGSDG
ncbi:MAG: hypothetical protein ACRELY_05000, partial [Polyangiaceae bacterium]